MVMESDGKESHAGMSCSLDDLIKKEAPKKQGVTRTLKRNAKKGRQLVKNRKTAHPERKINERRDSHSARPFPRGDTGDLLIFERNKESRPRSLYNKRNFHVRTELNTFDKIPGKYYELSGFDEREKIVKLISLEHNDEDFTLRVLFDSNPIIIVNKITGVIQLNSFNCRTSDMLDLWNLLLRPLGLSLQVLNFDDCTKWSITDGSCYLENFRDGMIVRGSGSRDTARNARFSILEQHIRQLII
ncbi:hypothetical protein HWI79_1778 [Cryptosporidium felis]|nr:hypothetical protein HWI79_1778 [Cryptosporidium felis]